MKRLDAKTYQRNVSLLLELSWELRKAGISHELDAGKPGLDAPLLHTDQAVVAVRGPSMVITPVDDEGQPTGSGKVVRPDEAAALLEA